jgi:hypothetical protein
MEQSPSLRGGGIYRHRCAAPVGTSTVDTLNLLNGLLDLPSRVLAQHFGVNPFVETTWKSGISQWRGGGSGEPLPGGGNAKETLVLEIIEPCPGEGFEILLQPHVDMGCLAVIVIATNLLHEAHVFVPER